MGILTSIAFALVPAHFAIIQEMPGLGSGGVRQVAQSHLISAP